MEKDGKMYINGDRNVIVYSECGTFMCHLPHISTGIVYRDLDRETRRLLHPTLSSYLIHLISWYQPHGHKAFKNQKLFLKRTLQDLKNQEKGFQLMKFQGSLSLLQLIFHYFHQIAPNFPTSIDFPLFAKQTMSKRGHESVLD